MTNFEFDYQLQNRKNVFNIATVSMHLQEIPNKYNIWGNNGNNHGFIKEKKNHNKFKITFIKQQHIIIAIHKNSIIYTIF